MADRPRSGGPDDEPKFDWLYDGDDPGSSPETRAPRPDETRMMRTQPRERPQGQPVERPAVPPGQPVRSRPTPPPIAPLPSPAGSGRRGLRRPRVRIRRIVLLLLVAWIAYLVLVPFLAWNKVQKASWEPDGERPAEQPGTTYLLVGSDSRADLTKAERQELSTGDPTSQLTDTIMLLHTGSGPNLLMSIPRDSLVEIPGYGTGKINSAYSKGGTPLLVQTLEQDTGIRIDDYAEIGLGGVVDMVDAVGGIQICPNHRMRDKLAGLNVKKGCQEVDGATALAYSRSRHTNLKLGDVARARQQREVVKAVGKKALSPWTFVNPVRYWHLAMAVPAAFTFGDGTSKVTAGRFGLAMSRVNGSHGLTCSVPISDLSVRWDPTRSKEMFAKIISDDTADIGDLCTPSGFPKKATS